MKNILITIFAFAASNIFAQKDCNSLLWEISGNGLTEPSYLYGTIHMIEKEDFSVRPEIDSVFAKSVQIAFEVDMDDFVQLMGMETWLKLPMGITLQTLCSPEQFEIIRKYFSDSLGMDIMEFNDYKPFVLYQQIISGYMKGETESFELYFATKSMKANKEIVGLETVSEQLQLFDSIPYSVQIDWVIQSIQHASEYALQTKQLFEAYRNEDLTEISELLEESSPELEEYDEQFIVDRNKKWVPVIETLIRQKTTFIAVGAGHLVGKHGLIRLLKKAGYTVKPVN